MEKDQFIVASILRKEIVDLEKQKEEILRALEIKQDKFYSVYKWSLFLTFWERELKLSFALSNKILQNVLQEIERDIEEKTKQFDEL